ncbi:hypothetical protein SAOR_14235 [Salinisphaera orenii MK-B5]|uniref:Glycosyltransferase RgtA/B/C/D-like domain-containing protein n=1 Tax=Salinisphaera orenii MK-B5 TaxID=856730 RepID=A0A423PGT7_9GAMM|nr:hypothetical protein [Salinisphaera orenii]ROO24753.1 hypothetical protein SAOR_14235 [Salinisphaera orenii MK-B5]
MFSGFNALHFHVDYVAHGFVRRGLVGTLLSPLPDPVRGIAALAFGVAVAAGLIAVMTRMLRTARACLAPADARGLTALVVASPATFLAFGYDFARYDQLNLLLAAAAVWLVRRQRVWAAAAVCVLALLVHEAFLFYGVPLVLAAAGAAAHASDAAPAAQFRRALTRGAPVLVACVPTVAVIMVFGRYEPGHDALAASLAEHLTPANRNALFVWLRDSDAAAGYVAGRLGQGLFSPLEVGLLMATVGGIVAAFVATYRANARRLDLWALVPLGVLPLFAVGVDYARWLGVAWMLALAVVVLQVRDGRFTRLPRGLSGRWPWLLALAGPLGTVGGLPLLRLVFG